MQVDYCRQQCDESTHFSLYVIRPRGGQDVDIATVQKEIMEYCLVHRMHVPRWRHGRLGPKSAWSRCFRAGVHSEAQKSRLRARSAPQMAVVPILNRVRKSTVKNRRKSR